MSHGYKRGRVARRDIGTCKQCRFFAQDSGDRRLPAPAMQMMLGTCRRYAPDGASLLGEEWGVWGVRAKGPGRSTLMEDDRAPSLYLIGMLIEELVDLRSEVKELQSELEQLRSRVDCLYADEEGIVRG